MPDSVRIEYNVILSEGASLYSTLASGQKCAAVPQQSTATLGIEASQTAMTYLSIVHQGVSVPWSNGAGQL